MEDKSNINLSPMKHILNTNWVVWYHSPTDKSWSRESYKPILELESLEDYLVLENSWLKCFIGVIEGMFFKSVNLSLVKLTSAMGRYK